MRTISFIRKSILLSCVLCISNSINAQIAVENSTPEDDKVQYVYYTDGSSNFDFDRLWHDYNNVEMQIDYCKAFIGQKILFTKGGYGMYVLHATYQIKDIEGGEYLLDFISQIPEYGKKTKLGSFPIHKFGTCEIGQAVISEKGKYGWSDVLKNAKGKRIGTFGKNVACRFNIGTEDEKQKFFSQFLLIKGAYTEEEATRMIEESKEKLLQGNTYLPYVQKQIKKWEKKAQKGKLEGKELKAYQKFSSSSSSDWDNTKYYKLLFNGKEYYAEYLKGDTLISMHDPTIPEVCCLLVEDNNGQEYFITIDRDNDRDGCITEKHFNHVKEQYVSQYVVRTYDGEVVGTTMKCEDIVLRDGRLQAKLKDVKTGEIDYVPLSYASSSCYLNEEYSPEENGACFYLKNYEVIVPEGL